MMRGWDLKFSCGPGFGADMFLVMASSAGSEMSHILDSRGANPTKCVILNQGFTCCEGLLHLGSAVQELE